MAWKDAWSYASRWIGKDQSEQRSDRENSDGKREDANLPLNARVGSVVVLQKTPMIRAQAQGSLLEMPSDDETLIVAISRIRTELEGKLYRYYLQSGDADIAEKFIQVYVDANGEVKELAYYSRLCRLVPESVEDQQIFSGEAGYGLGDASYTMWRWQLEEMGWDEDRLQATFLDQDHVLFQRDAGDPHAEFVMPFRGTETRIDKADGSEGLQQQVIFMPYSRALSQEQNQHRELMLISTEIIESTNGDRNKRGIYVDFMIGIPVETERLVVQ